MLVLNPPKGTGAKKIHLHNRKSSHRPHTTKIHIVDGLGNPLEIILTDGQVHDSQVAQALISRLKIAWVNVVADKAYGSEAFRQYLEAEEGTYTIPPKSTAKEKWPVDYYVYRERHLIENFFNQLKNY